MGRTAHLHEDEVLKVENAAMRRRLVALFVVCIGSLFSAGPSAARPEPASALQARLARALAVPQVAKTTSSAIAVDLQTGDILFQRNPDLPLVPASNEKLAVAYAALVALGPGFRIPTEVLGRGHLLDGVWRGDLILKGYGDPTLSTHGLRSLARQLRAAGIRVVTGRVVGDESYFDSRRIGPGWKTWYYINESPPLSALAVDRGRYEGRTARDPALAAAGTMRAELRRVRIRVAGAAVTGRAPGHALPLASIESPPLHVILRLMNRESDNFTSELILKQLGTLFSERGTTARGGRMVRETLADSGIPLFGVRIADGSGLSRSNRLTARALIALLQSAWADVEVGQAFVRSLAVAGRNGTLRDRMRRWPAAGRVFAKTGTTSVASALSGFVKNRFAFVVLHNGRPISHYWARLAQDRFAAVLASQ
jgi:D-alanyl-D-alanine carboxypeptidase/D-alanyl-D-alanine-endopeptidase (penicillin-binding protein 4)